MLAQLPQPVLEQNEIVVRADSAAVTRAFCDELRDLDINFLAHDLTEGVREAILALPESAWRLAVRQDGEPPRRRLGRRDHRRLDLGARPDGCRVIVRRARPHPDAQRPRRAPLLATLTDLPGDAIELERTHRARASAEDRIRAAKQTEFPVSAASTTSPSGSSSP